MEKSKIMLLYNSVLERINSRFIVRGKVEGKLFLVSSKKSEYDFIESYIRKQEGKPGIYVVDGKLWDVKPSGTYCGDTFCVAVGGSNLPSKVIPDDEVNYLIKFEDGSEKVFNYNDIVRLSDGTEKLIQNIKSGDDIVGLKI